MRTISPRVLLARTARVSALALAVSCASTAPAGGGAASAGDAGASGVTLLDPTGDDKGPGNYVYPTDAVYVRGAFDITKVEVVPRGDEVEFRVTVQSPIADPWDSRAWGGNGFSVQMAFIHIDTDHKEGSGVTTALPGLNVRFDAKEAWDRVVVLSPQGATRVNSEIDQKAPTLKDKIVVPRTTRAQGRTLIAIVTKDQLGGLPAAGWGYQVLMQSNEGFPEKTDLLTRKVNEFEGQHRFGGGSDYDNDPHVIDMLMSPAKGGAGEADAQFQALSKFNKETQTPKPEELALVPMVYPAP